MTTPKIQNIYFKIFYYTLLDHFTFEKIEEFWKLCPLILEGKEISGEEKIKMIYRDYSKLSLRYFIEATSRIEEFCIENNVSFEALYKTFHRLSQGINVFDNEYVYYIVDLSFKIIYNIKPSAIHYLFHYIPKISKVFSPENSHDLVYYKREKNRFNFIYYYYYTCPQNFNTYVDYYIFIVYAILKTPGNLGLPDISQFKQLCDPRKVESIVSKRKLLFQMGGKVLIDNKQFGYKTSLFSFLETYPKVSGTPKKKIKRDQEVVLIEKDYYCPVRKRVVLYKGCVYGASFGLTEFNYEVAPPNLKSVIERVKKRLNFSVNNLPGKSKNYYYYEDLHTRFLDYMHMKYSNYIEYNESTDKITINSKLLIRNTPARILKKILLLNKQKDQIEFEYWQFIEDPEIILNKDVHNLTRRMERLANALIVKTNCIRIEKTGRGKIRLNVCEEYTFSIVE